MNIDGLTNGIVLDHITAGKGMRIYEMLKLDKLDCTVAIIQNATSSKKGRKDIIKIDTLIDLNYDMIAYVDSNVTIDIIKNGKVSEKRSVKLPETLTNIISCHNPRCITSTEQGIDQIFRLVDPERRIYRCAYCDTEYSEK
ncbi:MAG: aspartate carbamoyltransferase regulatory subunit [Clostridiales bacterium]|jgi:aspartate carbamoyltransferase regulatory subunit|nr:aspartate carbamoyltransferase regulatory subunit [Clostridiales bacterium]